jgi:molecular chaperone IbpA
MSTLRTFPNDIFRDFDRIFIGGEQLLRAALEDGPALASKYPPYNIEQVNEDNYRITIAVAGFGQDELDVQLHYNTLTVTGIKKTESESKVYVYRGIAEREFRRQFKLLDYIKVKSIELENGLLVIDLLREVPEALKPRKLDIGYKSE